MALSPAQRLVAADLLRQRALVDVLARLAEHGVDVLVIKGAALAHLVYDQPHHRARCDADLLIHRRQLDAADRILRAHGYVRQLEPDTEVASAQRHYAPRQPSADSIDLHWRVVNPRVFGEVLPFDDVWPRSIAVPALGQTARTLAFPDALVLACVHRVAHHGDSVEPRWLEDIALLAKRLEPDAARHFVREAARTGTLAVCTRSLELAGQHCDAKVDGLVSQLAAASEEIGPDGVERSVFFIRGPRTLVSVLASDLRCATWRDRIRLLGEHLFPSRAYMRAKYPHWPLPLLPLAYPFRVARGAPAWFRRDTSGVPFSGS
jgi:hypothetical protein